MSSSGCFTVSEICTGLGCGCEGAAKGVFIVDEEPCPFVTALPIACACCFVLNSGANRGKSGFKVVALVSRVTSMPGARREKYC